MKAVLSFGDGSSIELEFSGLDSLGNPRWEGAGYVLTKMEDDEDEQEELEE